MSETRAKMDRKDFYKRVSASRRWLCMAHFRVVGLVALATVTAVDAAAQLAAGGKEASRREPGTVFRDCPQCPEMVVVPAGSFTMGSPSSEEGRRNDEGPRHRVRISEPFAVGKYEVTFAEWNACAADGGCGGYRHYSGRGKVPVIQEGPVIWVSWDDAQSYAGWLSRKTGKEYRLLSESEWEYAARVGLSDFYAMKRWREHRARLMEVLKEQAEGPNAAFAKKMLRRMRERTLTAGNSLPTVSRDQIREDLIYIWDDLIYEWVQDCSNGSYAGAPADGSAWESGNCGLRVARSFWGGVPRLPLGADDPSNIHGFRVARTLAP